MTSSNTFDGQWLYARGDKSVRIRRVSHHAGAFQLLVSGPSEARQTHTCHTIADCIQLQQQLESELVAQGFRLSKPERRKQPEMAHEPDRRRD